MEKPRSRHTAGKHPLIIDRPDLQTWPQRAVSKTLTTLFWLIWLGLWLPLATLLGWAMFGWQFKVHMFDLGGLERFVDLLAVYAAVIAAMSGSLMAWARYNYLRFRGKDRRRSVGSVPLHALAARAGQSTETVQDWHAMRIMVAHHDANGHIVRVADKTAADRETHHLPPHQAVAAAALSA
ncbi:poly-beta-1,6-N-acetyl-D-glucosamine biosynthesis protein PgaD [Thauera sinica]|uniref:Poly-beta-1,6-N-acetyl-D-glucosamine biosynthesis protein PgaD n=1 Tax=Thauera sinica TaxID=2665146 RepID=A0ABW1ASM7_9RHOO|nr:poly-beta-1,6-N-acetyl-D-glucosamine biosynthesis protein PgaD [Thauera sp. K11]